MGELVFLKYCVFHFLHGYYFYNSLQTQDKSYESYFQKMLKLSISFQNRNQLIQMRYLERIINNSKLCRDAMFTMCSTLFWLRKTSVCVQTSHDFLCAFLFAYFIQRPLHLFGEFHPLLFLFAYCGTLFFHVILWSWQFIMHLHQDRDMYCHCCDCSTKAYCDYLHCKIMSSKQWFWRQNQ